MKNRQAVAPRPQFHQLEIFLNVAEAKTFAGAARMMGRTQPAISQAIARLEEIYGGDLFQRRRGARLALTPIGEAILPSARTILDTIDEQMTRAVATAQSRAGNLALGFFPGLAAGPLSAGIADFLGSSPQVRLRLVEAFPADLHRYLNERAIDLIIVALLPPLDNRTFTQERLWEERLAIALPVGHAFARKAALAWQDVAALPILFSHSQVECLAYRTMLERVDRPTHLDHHDVSSTTLLDMVGLGMGAAITLVSTLMPHNGVVFRPINETDATIGIDAVWPKDDRNPLRHRLLSLIREHKDDSVADALAPIPPSTAPAPDRG